MWRRPRTQQERRACCNREYREFGVRIRAKRCLRQLVHAFLDLPRQRQRNWKSYRRTQYKILLPPVRPRNESRGRGCGDERRREIARRLQGSQVANAR